MVDYWGSIVTIALGGLGWLVTSFFGRPYMQFHDLRSEVIQKSVLYDNVSAAAKQRESDGYRSHVELTDVELERLRKAQEEFRDLAARMRAFALNEPLTVRFVKFCGTMILWKRVQRFSRSPILWTPTAATVLTLKKPLSICCA